MKKKDDFYDDGRTIADMNVEGMPYYYRKPKKFSKSTDKDAPKLTSGEQRQVIVSGMLAGAVIAGLFIAAAAVFILILVLLG